MFLILHLLLRKNKNLYPFSVQDIFNQSYPSISLFFMEALYSTEVTVAVKNDKDVCKKSEDRSGVLGFASGSISML